MNAKKKVKTKQDILSSKPSVTRVRSPPYGKQAVRWALLITRRVTGCTASMWLERRGWGRGVGWGGVGRDREREWEERWPNTRKKQWSHTTWLIFPADTSSPNHNIPVHVCVCVWVFVVKRVRWECACVCRSAASYACEYFTAGEERLCRLCVCVCASWQTQSHTVVRRV